ncbi:unnamed protein product, partial [Prorocentrum cordatum]
VQRPRRLRTRCGSRWRGTGLAGSGAAWGTPGAAPSRSSLLPGLSGEEGGVLLASPLLPGLVRADTEAHSAPWHEGAAWAEPWEPGPLSGRSATTAASPRKKSAWADIQDDFDDEASECSTHSPDCSSGSLSSDGSCEASDGQAARRRGPSSLVQPRSGSVLAQGLMPILPEETCARPPVCSPEPGSLVEVIGTHPSGAHAVVTTVDREEGTYEVQLMSNGRRTRHLKIIKFKHARLLRHA